MRAAMKNRILKKALPSSLGNERKSEYEKRTNRRMRDLEFKQMESDMEFKLRQMESKRRWDKLQNN